MNLNKPNSPSSPTSYPLEIAKDGKTYYRMQISTKSVWYTIRNSEKQILGFTVIDKVANIAHRFDMFQWNDATALEAELNSH